MHVIVTLAIVAIVLMELLRHSKGIGAQHDWEGVR